MILDNILLGSLCQPLRLGIPHMKCEPHLGNPPDDGDPDVRSCEQVFQIRRWQVPEHV